MFPQASARTRSVYGTTCWRRESCAYLQQIRAEKVERLKELKSTWILLSAIESRSIKTVGKMANSIKLELADARILLGLWSLPTEGAARWIRRIKESSESTLYTNIEQAIRGIASLVPQVSDELQTSARKPDGA